MNLKYDIAKLERAMYDFNKATGVSITLYDSDQKPITSSGIGKSEYCTLIYRNKDTKSYCKISNKELLDSCKSTKRISKHICKAGLLDIAIPILHSEEIVGYLMIGQIKQSENVSFDFTELEKYFVDIEKKYNEIPLFDEEKINSIINIGTMLTKYIMLENMVRSNSNRISTLIETYVNMHLTEHIDTRSIAKDLHISTSGIYKAIHQNYNMTLGEFISKKRIKMSFSLLEETDLTISEISEAIGFYDASYYTKSFKKFCGITPSAYRKNSRK